MRGDTELELYGAAMRAEMTANAHKAHWNDQTIDEALAEVGYHLAKLVVACDAGDKPAVLEYAADVGNCAMMVADIVDALGEESTPEPTLIGQVADVEDYGEFIEGVRTVVDMFVNLVRSKVATGKVTK